MKPVRIVSLIVAGIVALSIGLMASEFQFTACTRDARTAVLDVSFPDQTPPRIAHSVNEAFRETASELDADALIGPTGFQLFISKLSDAAKAILVLKSPPEITSQSCN